MMASSFPRFLQLPAEIRRLIWKECLPKQRVFEIDSAGMLFEEIAKKHTCRGTGWATMQNWKPPIITRVCRESRNVAWETGWIELGKYGYDEENYDFWNVCNQWFAPTTDIVALYGSPGQRLDYQSLYGSPRDSDDPILDMIEYARECQGALIPANRIRTWGWSGVANFDVTQLKEYLVCLEVVMIHVTMEGLVHSSLFGRLGEEYIQLVDPMDVITLQKFYRLTMLSKASEVPETNEFFKSAIDTKALQERAKTWSQRVTFCWIFHDWLEEEKRGFRGIPCPEEIWLGPKTDDKGEPYDMLSRRSFEGRTIWEFPVTDRFLPNEQHPWVSPRLAKMPTFRPRIMFRPCKERCWVPPTPPSLRRRRGRGPFRSR
jgi:hypothetical protein